MTQEVHQHPNGLIYIRTDQGIYGDTLKNYLADGGTSLPALPEGATERVYTQGKRHAIMGGGDIIEGGPLPWPLGDQLIADVASLLAAKSTRDEAARQAFEAAMAVHRKST
jgi:hypothetical protein